MYSIHVTLKFYMNKEMHYLLMKKKKMSLRGKLYEGNCIFDSRTWEKIKFCALFKHIADLI